MLLASASVTIAGRAIKRLAACRCSCAIPAAVYPGIIYQGFAFGQILANFFHFNVLSSVHDAPRLGGWLSYSFILDRSCWDCVSPWFATSRPQVLRFEVELPTVVTIAAAWIDSDLDCLKVARQAHIGQKGGNKVLRNALVQIRMLGRYCEGM
jgi:hypothetical protein